MRRQFVFQQFGTNGIGMPHTPLFTIGAMFLAMGFLVLALPEILIFFVASFLIFFGILFLVLGFNAWRISRKIGASKASYGKTEIIDDF